MTEDNDERDHENRDVGRETLSESEVHEAIQRLTAEEKTKLMKVAMALKWKTRDDHDDLFNEGIERVLSGKRAWRRGTPAVPFFKGVMQSIAWEWRSELPGSPTEDDLSEGPDQEDRLIVNETVEIILSSFDDDLIAKTTVMEMMKKTPAQEMKHFIMCKFGLSETEYESKRTKVRRRLETIRRNLN